MACRRALERGGFTYVHTRGSHMILVHRGHGVRVSVPRHKELDRGTLRGILRQAGLCEQEFLALLD